MTNTPNKHGRDARNRALKAATRRYVASEVAAGGRLLTLAQAKAELAELGYRLERHGPYLNDYPTNRPHRWLAMMCGAVHVATGLSFAHVDCPRTTLPRLQKLRREVVVVHQGRVWEI